MPHIQPYNLYQIIAVVSVLLILSSCRINGQTLRGGEMLFVRLPIHAAQEDSITVTNDHVASRSFVPVTVHTDINRVIMPDSLWNELEQLRLSWCKQRPSFASTNSSDADYNIVLKCDWAEDADYFVRTSDLPTPLQELIALVPSTSERLLSQ